MTCRLANDGGVPGFRTRPGPTAGRRRARRRQRCSLPPAPAPAATSGSNSRAVSLVRLARRPAAGRQRRSRPASNRVRRALRRAPPSHSARVCTAALPPLARRRQALATASCELPCGFESRCAGGGCGEAAHGRGSATWCGRRRGPRRAPARRMRDLTRRSPRRRNAAGRQAIPYPPRVRRGQTPRARRRQALLALAGARPAPAPTNGANSGTGSTRANRRGGGGGMTPAAFVIFAFYSPNVLP